MPTFNLILSPEARAVTQLAKYRVAVEKLFSGNFNNEIRS